VLDLKDLDSIVLSPAIINFQYYQISSTNVIKTKFYQENLFSNYELSQLNYLNSINSNSFKKRYY